MPLNSKPSESSWFHCLQATSQALQPIQSEVSVKNPTLLLSDIAHEGFALVDGDVRVGDEGGEVVGDAPGGVALPAEVPGHAHLVDGAAADAQGLEPLGHERAGFGAVARGRDDHAVAVGDAELPGELGADLDEALGL